MRKIWLALVFVAGCTTSAPLDDAAELKAYAACNFRNSVEYATKPGDPYSLAIAAEAGCPREKLALLNLYGDKRGPGPALRLIRQLERTAVNTNVGTIARARS